MKTKLIAANIFYAVLLTLCANSYIYTAKNSNIFCFLLSVFVVLNVIPGLLLIKTGNIRLKFSCHGAVLLSVFLISTCLSVIFHIISFIILLFASQLKIWLMSAFVCFTAEAIVFWNGIISVYICSYQLGIKQRLIGALCGLIPILNLIVLCSILKKVYREVLFEESKERLNESRRDACLCATKYPILLVHGVFFRDFRYFNYWGRIPAQLEQNGARVYYGNQQSASSVAQSAEELSLRIRELCRETGCEKLNIIAHSKGGLDCRYALSKLGVADCVASLTTVNTPHRGCEFADYLLEAADADFEASVAGMYNKTLKKLGDPSPDFLAAVYDLTASACGEFDKELVVPADVYCQSIGSVLKKAKGGKFPLNLSYRFVKYFDGENDGLVSESSFAFGERYILIRPEGDRGVSHGDMIDLNRENFEGFDVREFYVRLVNELKQKGL